MVILKFTYISSSNFGEACDARDENFLPGLLKACQLRNISLASETPQAKNFKACASAFFVEHAKAGLSLPILEE